MFIFSTILIVLLTYLLWSRRKLYKLSWQLPGPFAYPIIGNALALRRNKVHSYIDRLSKEYESPFRVWLGPILLVFITDAENTEILLKSKDCLGKPETFYKTIKDGLGVDGLVTLKGEEWKVHRRLVTPTLSRNSVNAHLPVFNENIKKMMRNLPENGEFFDILPLIAKCKMTMFVEAALGTNWESEMKQRYIHQYVAGVEIVAKRILQPLLHFDFIWNFTEGAKRLKEYNQYGHQLFEKLYHNELKNEDDSGTFMRRLLDVSKKNPNFMKEDIFAETATILTSATDTTSTSSAYVALMLAMHPEYQEKVFQEILTVMPDKNGELTQASLDKLEFTELCIKETLRLFPTVPLIGRVANKPIKLNNNVEIPPNVPLIFGLRQTQIQEKYYGPTAHIFNPYRFLDENFKNVPAAAYIPFSYGPRNCIGYYYAKVSVKCFIAYLVRNYRLTTTYTEIDQFQFVKIASLRLVKKHLIKLEPRA